MTLLVTMWNSCGGVKTKAAMKTMVAEHRQVRQCIRHRLMIPISQRRRRMPSTVVEDGWARDERLEIPSRLRGVDDHTGHS